MLKISTGGPPVSVTRFDSSVFSYSKENVVQGRAERQAKSARRHEGFRQRLACQQESLACRDL